MYKISGIWTDVMRMGLLPEEIGKDDADWWIEHQNEIGFALRVLMGLRLAVVPNEFTVSRCQKHKEALAIKPSNAMKRLHRHSRAHYGYRDKRDKQLRASVARRM
jgi:hypothetical protein